MSRAHACRIASALTLGYLLALASGPAGAAGFDCAKAWGADEKRVCAVPALSALDVQLNQAYRAATAATFGDDRKALAAGQRAWLERRRANCIENDGANDDCLAALYRERLGELEALAASGSRKPALAGDLAIRRMTPEGDDVPPGRQLVLQFDRDVVPVGDMRRDAAALPITVTPALACEWRWLNSSALACQLGEKDAMKPATSYRVTVAPGLKTVDGTPMRKAWTGTFVTRRPSLQNVESVFWLTPQKPILRLTFADPVTKTSLAKVLSIRHRGAVKPPPFDLHPDDLKRQFPEWMLWLGLDAEQPDEVNDRFMRVGNDEARSIWLLVPKNDLPAEAAVELKISPGLVTPLGNMPGIEDRLALTFDTFPPFRFLGIRCQPNEPDPAAQEFTDIDVAQLTAADGATRCDPLAPVMLRFSSPVLASQVKTGVAFSPRLDGGRKDYDPWANTEDYSVRSNAHTRGRHYAVWLPELLKAAQEYRIELGAGLQDEFGRKLAAPLSLTFRTSHRDPRLVIDYRDIVLEKDVDSQATGYVTNIDQLGYRGETIDAWMQPRKVVSTQPIANIQDISYRFALMVREILGGKSGAAWFCVDSTPPMVQSWYEAPCLFAQVTPFHVHAKLGHFTSLAWVTDMRTGEPVPGARVEVVLGKRPALAALQPFGPEPRALTKTDALGVALLPGIEVLDPQLKYLRWNWDRDNPGLFLRVVVGEDMALLPLDNAFDAQPGNGIWSDLKQKGEHTHAWGFSAQGVHRGGDTVDLKVYVRDQQNKHWVAPAVRSGYALRVTDPTGAVAFQQDAVALDAFGAAAFSFVLSADAVGGWYDVQLRRDAESTWQPLRFLVSDFTPAPFRTESLLQGDLFAPGTVVNVNTRATLYSGGPFSGAQARVRARIVALPYAPGTTATKGYTFGTWDYSRTAERDLGEQQGQVDKDGAFAAQFTPDEAGIYYGRLLVESSVSDDRGKFVSAQSGALYVARDRFVGVKPRNWLFNAGEEGFVDLIVADPRGKLVADSEIALTLQKRVIRSARVQGPGDAYLLRNTGDWEEVAVCKVASRSDGSVNCAIVPPTPGDYRLLATVKDSQGRDYTTEDNIWVIGSGWVNWASDNDSGLEILPENDEVIAGQTARYLVKNPYPGARALITVERYGVLSRRVETLKDSSAVIDIPVTGDMAPGFFLSVVIASPRVDKPLEGEVDLGKPAFRMGYVQTKVKAPDKQVKITLQPAREEYRPREEIVAKLKAKLSSASGKPLSVAVIAIDEAVLALNSAGTGYYDPEAGFNRLDGLDVANWNLVTRLVGRQKIEKKGANPGGDGGKADAAFSAMREKFRYVALWQGDLKLDAQGEAELRFPAPDNLTGWRLLAVAVTADDSFGLGQANVKVNRPTEIRPAMPNQVTEGDRFTARFTVMNRTKSARTLSVRVDGTGAEITPLATTLELAPYEQKVVELPVTTTAAGEIRFRASAGDALDSDTLAHAFKVKPRRAREVAANYGSTTDAQAIDHVALPAEVFADASVLSVVLAPTVLGNLDGAYRYIADYPYECWEQRLAKAVMHASSKPLKPWLKESKLPADPDALVRAQIASAAAFQAPNGGMTFWVARNDYVSPYLSAYTALAFRWLARGGYVIPRDVETKLHDYLRGILRSDQVPGFAEPGMAASVRAVALAALSDAGSIDKSEVLRYAAHMPRMTLFGKAHYLQALANSGAPTAELRRTSDALLAMGSQSGGKFQFMEQLDDNYSQLLATPLRDNCAALSALLRVRTVPSVAERVGDVPFRLVRMITQARGSRDHFENTQENVFCMNALYGYARAYESEKPAMTVKARYDVTPLAGKAAIAPRAIGEAAFAGVQDPSKLLRLPLTAADAGRAGKVVIDRKGSGRVYYSTRLEFAPKDAIAKAANAGIEVLREYSLKRGNGWQLLKGGETLARGDLLRVDLFVKTPAARHYVVVDDPVPGLLEPVNTDLATDSTFDDGDAKWQRDAKSFWFSNRDGWQTFGAWGYSFYHRELRHDAVRFYADLLPAGNYHLAWTGQVIAAGEFTAQAVYAGEMYDIDVFGRGLPTTLRAGAGNLAK